MKLSTVTSDIILKSLLHSAPDGILICNRQGTILVASDQCSILFGYPVAVLVGRCVDILVPEAFRAKHSELRRNYMTAPNTRPMGAGLKLHAQRSDGSILPVEISLSGCEVEGEDCVIAVIRDVSERRRLEDNLQRLVHELKRSNEELEQFAYIASHDLQEPLRVVSGYTQLLKRRYGAQLDHEAHEYIDFSVEGVKRMQTLINDLLSFARLSTRGREFKPTDLKDLLGHLMQTLTPVVDEAAAKVEIGDLPTVMADSSQLSQVFQNLISNSLKFRAPERQLRIKIWAERRGDQWVIAVADNGIGMDPKYKDRIFIAFQRLHTRDQFPGNGIGLAICKKVIERHHGQIWFESALGAGSTFYFTLAATGSGAC